MQSECKAHNGGMQRPCNVHPVSMQEACNVVRSPHQEHAVCSNHAILVQEAHNVYAEPIQHASNVQCPGTTQCAGHTQQACSIQARNMLCRSTGGKHEHRHSIACTCMQHSQSTICKVSGLALVAQCSEDLICGGVWEQGDACS